jgi:DNA-directed RNA polymerase subunit RPC12/RpoP
MPATARYACPDCGSIDLAVVGLGIAEASQKAVCPNCSWEGMVKDTIGFATTEQVWDIERVADVMLRVSNVHAAGPLVQCLEFVGILPKKLDKAPEGKSETWLAAHNSMVQQMRDFVMQETFTGMLTNCFEAAAMANKKYAAELGITAHPALHESDTVFGGDADAKVVPITKRKKRKKK